MCHKPKGVSLLLRTKFENIQHRLQVWDKEGEEESLSHGRFTRKMKRNAKKFEKYEKVCSKCTGRRKCAQKIKYRHFWNKVYPTLMPIALHKTLRIHALKKPHKWSVLLLWQEFRFHLRVNRSPTRTSTLLNTLFEKIKAEKCSIYSRTAWCWYSALVQRLSCLVTMESRAYYRVLRREEELRMESHLEIVVLHMK